MTFDPLWPAGHLIGDTGRKARVVGELDVLPGQRRRFRVMAEDEFGGTYEEIYRLDGTWPFNALGNFDLHNAP